ncbi:MAG: DUF1295 domain-containing protein [Acidobacteriia bacterium]|nr:DUF1295 domain-containing protein [Terriglobia bacterium]MYG02486.1 DUF1295 domain-containing protein [Terriglobia bacterium]MYK08745.1 DUF1295 domain-containing protein [Terriglobia bacterium]
MPGLDLFSHPLSGQPYGSALELCLVLVVLAWIVTLVTGDCCEWMDRLWALSPPVYCLMVAVLGGFDVARVNLMTALVILWGARLTYNFARKGGFRKGGADYRWGVLKERIGPTKFLWLNIAFVAPGQLLLMWLFTSPVHQAWVWRDQPLGWLDGVSAVLFLLCFAGELIGDEQMWKFQQDKKRRIAAGQEIVQPFIVTGLFRYTRHPSYLCEIGMWLAFWLFAVSASGDWFHWTGLGLVLLATQFIGVIRMTEKISAGKYPTYAEYRARTPIVPLPGLRR